MARPGWERRSSGPHRKNWPAPLRDAHRDDASSAAKKRGDWSAGLRPASRGSAKPAPPPHVRAPESFTMPKPRINSRDSAAEWERLPTRTSAGRMARPGWERRSSGPHRKNWPAPLRDAHRDDASSAAKKRGDWSAGLRPASRGSAKPAPMTLRHANVSVPSSPSTGCLDRYPLPLPAAAPFHARRGVLEDPIMRVSPRWGPAATSAPAQPRSR